MFQRLIAIAFASLVSLPAFSGEIEFEKLGISLSVSDQWFTLAPEILDKINRTTSMAAVSHASRLGKKLDSEDAGSSIVLLKSKFLLGTNEDNPNFLLATEKPWSDQFERSGKGYLDLMADRVKRLNVPTRFAAPPKEMKIGDAVFFFADAENTVNPKAKTKQRYICGFVNDRYVYFVLSYNREDDEDFRAMMKSVESLRPIKPTK